ncbi:MAG: hypothetical protein R3F39_08285 [Myxococcota bacterium]
MSDTKPSDTSPPMDALGLLGDLAAEARAERAALASVRDERAEAAAEARRRDEAVRREALQAELIEETRRRNATRLLTAPEVETERPVTRAAAEPAMEAAVAPAPKRTWMMAAGLLLLVAGGGAAFAVAQAPGPGMEVDGLASRASEVAPTVVAASMTARAAAVDSAPVAADLQGADDAANAEGEAKGEPAAEGEPATDEAAAPEGTDEAEGANSEAGTEKKPTVRQRPTVKKPPVKRPGVTTDFDAIYGGGKKR